MAFEKAVLRDLAFAQLAVVQYLDARESAECEPNSRSVKVEAKKSMQKALRKIRSHLRRVNENIDLIEECAAAKVAEQQRWPEVDDTLAAANQ